MFSYLLLEIIKFSTLKFIPRLVSASAHSSPEKGRPLQLESKSTAREMWPRFSLSWAAAAAELWPSYGKFRATDADSREEEVIDLLPSADPVLDQIHRHLSQAVKSVAVPGSLLVMKPQSTFSVVPEEFWMDDRSNFKEPKATQRSGLFLLFFWLTQITYGKNDTEQCPLTGFQLLV